MLGEELSSVISNSRLLSTLQRDRQHCGTLLDHRVTGSPLACITKHRLSGCSATDEGVRNDATLHDDGEHSILHSTNIYGGPTGCQALLSLLKIEQRRRRQSPGEEQHIAHKETILNVRYCQMHEEN